MRCFESAKSVLIFAMVALVTTLNWVSCLTCSAQQTTDTLKAALFQDTAVISTSEGTKQLRDLLIVELGKNDFRLAGRQELLEARAGELKLASLSSADQVSNRREAANLVRADVLIILRKTTTPDFSTPKNSPAAIESDPTLEVVFAESLTGSRIGKLSLVDDDFDVLLPPILAKAKALRGKFSGGVSKIVAVAPFVPQNLSHDHDSMQTSIKRFIELSLAETPGVSVVEFDEANAILAENSLHADDTDRRVPAIVNGSYLVTDGDPAQIQIQSAIVHGNQKTSLEGTASFDPGALATWIQDNIVREIDAASTENGSTVSVQKQIENFISTANQFSELGDYDRSTGLREAALLLDPSNLQIRHRLVQEYAIHSNQNWATPLHTQHFEYIARNGGLKSQIEVRRMFLMKHRLQLFNHRGKRLPDVSMKAIEAEARFYLAAAQACQTLPVGELSPLDKEKLSVSGSISLPWWEIASSRMWDGIAYSKSVDRLLMQASIVEQYPQDQLPCRGLSIPYSRYHDNWKFHRHASEMKRAEWDTYFAQMMLSPSRHARMFGHLNRIYFFLYQARAIEVILTREEHMEFQEHLRNGGEIIRMLSEEDEQLLVESIEAFIELFKEVKKLERTDTFGRTQGYRHAGRGDRYIVLLRQIGELFEGVDAYFPERKFASKLPSVENPFIYSGAPDNIIKETHIGMGRLKLDKIDLQFAKDPINFRVSEYGFRSMINCETFDVLWTNKQLFLMKEPGKLEAFDIPRWDASLSRGANVSWDGRYVWVAGASTRAVHVIDSNDWSLNRVTSLPEQGRMGQYDRVAVTGYAPGKAIALGSFGKNHRAWCCKIIVDKTSEKFDPEVKLIHQARKVPNFANPEQTDVLDPNLAFIPSWMNLYEQPDGTRLVIASRNTRMWGQTASASPYSLLVNPDTEEISVLNRRTWGTFDNNIYSRKGQLFVASTLYTGLYEPAENERELEMQKLPGKGRRIVPHNGWLYRVSHGSWVRINVETSEVETLLSSRFPKAYHGVDACGSSAHYGLVAFGKHQRDTIRTSDDPFKEIAYPALYKVQINNQVPLKSKKLAVDPGDL